MHATKPTNAAPSDPHVVADDLCQVMGAGVETYVRAARLINASPNVISKAFEFALARAEDVCARAITTAGDRPNSTDTTIYRTAGRTN